VADVAACRGQASDSTGSPLRMGSRP
jgi:hypothetical protein